MSFKIIKISKKVLIILSIPFIAYILSYVIKFIMQLGRILGTIIRIIMSM